MNNKKVLIYGKADLNGRVFDAEIIDNVFVLRSDAFSKELVSLVLNGIVLFVPEARSGPKYYLCVSKMLNTYYSSISFEIQLLYRKYNDVNETHFEIESRGFSNAINSSFNPEQGVLDFIEENLNKDFLSCNINIDGIPFRCSFSNIAKYKNNNLCPVDFTSCLKLIPEDHNFTDKIRVVFNFALKLLQFLSINTYPIVDEIRVANTEGGYSKVEFFEDFSDKDNKNDKYLSVQPFSDKISQLLECFPSGITRQYNIYHYKREWVFEFDIVRLSGAFEDAFRDNVEKSSEYKILLTKRKEDIAFKELKQLLNDFSNKHSLANNEDFMSCRKLFDDYGGTLKNKLEFAINDFCKTMNYIIVDSGFFYSPTLFETRIKDARNAICHGLHNKKIDWKNAANDTLILQEIIYFILLKYKMKMPEEMIKDSIDCSFGTLNRSTSFYKKDDPRIKWVK